MDRLPPELLPCVAEYLEGRDLKSLSLVCSIWSEVARKLLVWKIFGLAHALRFLDQLLHDEDATTLPATHVRKIAFDPTTLGEPSENAHATLVLAMRTLSSILGICTSIRILRIGSWFGESLEELPFPLQEQIMILISSLEHLKHLDLNYSCHLSALGIAAPRLERLASLRLMANRRLTNEKRIPKLAMNLTYLTIVWGGLSSAQKAALADVFLVDSLQFLCLKILDCDDTTSLEQLGGLLQVRRHLPLAIIVVDSTSLRLTSSPVPLRRDGRSILFGIMPGMTVDHLFFRRAVTFIGSWARMKQRDISRLFASSSAGNGQELRIHEGSDMSVRDKAEIVELAKKNSREIVWF